MMNAVKQYFLEKHNQTIKEKNLQGSAKKTLNYNDAEHIGILFFTRNENMHRFINRFHEKIKADKKNFTALTLDDDVRQNRYLFEYSFFKMKEVGFFGKIKSEYVEQFVHQEFDYLFCVTIEHDIDAFDQILARSKAKCRVGNYREDKSHLYELMIRLNPNDDIDKLIEAMFSRTQAIRFN